MNLLNFRSLIAGLTLFGLIMPATVNAQVVAYGGLVERIYVNSEGTVHFRLKGDNCKRTAGEGNTYWTFKLGSATRDAWYSMLLTAALADKKVIARFASCDPDRNQPLIYMYVNA